MHCGTRFGGCLTMLMALAPLMADERPRVPLVSTEAATQHQKAVAGLLPKVEIIRTVRAEQSIGAPYGREIAPFELPPDSIASAIQFFENFELDTDPILSMPEMASFLITTKSGNTVRVCVYCGAQGAPLMFSLGGVRCVSKEPWKTSQGEAAVVVLKYIREAHLATSRQSDAKQQIK